MVALGYILRHYGWLPAALGLAAALAGYISGSLDRSITREEHKLPAGFRTVCFRCGSELTPWKDDTMRGYCAKCRWGRPVMS
jgi:hypothetical protein